MVADDEEGMMTPATAVKREQLRLLIERELGGKRPLNMVSWHEQHQQRKG